MNKKLLKKAQTGIEVLIIFGILIIGALGFGIYYISSTKENINLTENLEMIPFFSPDPSSVSIDTPPSCGDERCNNEETCSTCPHDCGACPPPEHPECLDEGYAQNWDCHCGVNSCEIELGETEDTCCIDCGSCVPGLNCQDIEEQIAETNYTDYSACAGYCGCTICYNALVCQTDYCLNLSPPTYDPLGGIYNTPKDVFLSYDNSTTQCPEYKIYYTTDETTPIEVPEEQYLQPFYNLFTNTIIKAKVFAKNIYGDTVTSPESSETYLFTEAVIDFCDSNNHFEGNDLNHPIQIRNALDLYNIRNGLGKNYILCADIDLEHTILSNESWYTTNDSPSEYGWLPIGTAIVGEVAGGVFTGSLNGNNYNIQNMFIYGRNNLGLFNKIGTNARIFNLELKHTIISGTNAGVNNWAGTLAATNNGGIIENVTSEGMLSGSGQNIGGLIGTQNSGLISSCYFDGHVLTNGVKIGGLVGELNGGVVEKSYVISETEDNNLTVTGNNHVGGLIGEVNGANTIVRMSYVEGDYVKNLQGVGHTGGLIGTFNAGTLENCYSKIDVIATNNFGGLIGYKNGGIVSKSYAVGTLTGTKQHDRGGGLVGKKTGDTNISNSFYDSDVAGEDAQNNLGIPKTTIEMKTATTFTTANWDLIDIWAINDYTNEGYPYLSVAPPNSYIIDPVYSNGPGLIIQNAPFDSKSSKSVISNPTPIYDRAYYENLLQIYRG